MSDHPQLKMVYQQSLIIALAMIIGCVLFGIMVTILSLKGTAIEPNSQTGSFRLIAGVLGLSALAASFMVKNIILSGSSNIFQPGFMKDPFSRLKMSVIIPFALCEGPVIFGLVIAFILKNPWDLILPSLIGCIGFFSHFPKYQEWEEWMKSNKHIL